VVVRYFGGTKLGVGGLINAYRSSAQLAIEASDIITKTIDVVFKINFEYPLLNKVMRLIKDYDVNIIEQTMELQCNFTLSIRKKKAEVVIQKFEEVYGINLIDDY